MQILDKNLLNESSHVLMIGIDGARSDAFRRITASLENQPEFNALVNLLCNSRGNYRTYAGGHLYDQTHQGTSSEAGWTSLLTGYWGNITNITEQELIGKGYYNQEIPTLANWFHYINAGNSQVVSLSDWLPFNILLKYPNSQLTNYLNYPSPSINGADVDVYYPFTNGVQLKAAINKITDDAIGYIRNVSQPTLLLLHYDDPDYHGHHHGFTSQEYNTALKDMLLQVNQLIEEVENSRNNGQKWLIVLVSDHGGGSGPHRDNSHGRQWWTDKQSFMIFNDGAIKIKGESLDDSVQGQTTFVPTILHYLGKYTPQLQPYFVDQPLGMAPKEEHHLRYDLSQQVLDAGFPQPFNQFHDFTIFKTKVSDVRTVLFFGDKHDDYTFIFNNNTFISYDNIGVERFVYPHNPQRRKMTNETWPELGDYAELIRFALYNPQLEDSFYLILSNNCYLRYNMDYRQIDIQPQAINDSNWNGLASYLSQIKFAFYSPELSGIYYFFLTNNDYIRFSITQNKVIDVEPLKITDETWYGLEIYADSIINGFYSNGKIHFITKPLSTS